MGYVYKSYLDPQLGIPLGSTISQLSIPSNPKIKSCVSNTLSRILSINLACLYTHTHTHTHTHIYIVMVSQCTYENVINLIINKLKQYKQSMILVVSFRSYAV